MTRWYGSLQNRLEERSKPKKPEIGMGCTEMWYSDREAYEVVRIKDDRHVVVRELKCKLIGSYYDQEYEYESDPNGREKTLFLTKKGVWREQIGKRLYNVFVMGYAQKYYDPSF